MKSAHTHTHTHVSTHLGKRVYQTYEDKVSNCEKTGMFGIDGNNSIQLDNYREIV